MANLYLSFVLWFLGYPEQSEQKIAYADSIAKDRGLPNNLAAVCFYQMFLSKIKHDVPAIERFANRLVSMSEKYDIGFSFFGGRVGQAYAAAYRDPTNVRLFDMFDEMLSLYKEKVSHLSQPFLLSLKARLHIAAERYEKAQSVLNEAADLIQSVDDRYAEAEVERLQGELWVMNGKGNPEERFLHALAVAEGQKAKMMQIRTAVSLCQLWQRQNKTEEAYRLLSESYGWFSEGFATNELREVRALLNELCPSQRFEHGETPGDGDSASPLAH
jgi:hypothetical protein